MRASRVCLTVFLGFALGRSWTPDYDLPLDRPYTLRNTEPSLLEQDRDRILADTVPMSWVYPRPCVSALDSSQVCGDDASHLHYRNDARQAAFSVEGLLAGEYRDNNPGYPIPTSTGGSGSMAYEGGVIGKGGKGPVSFYVDMRSYTQNLGNYADDTYDREPVDLQQSSRTGSISFASYSRYRGNISLDLPYGRLTVARDAAQWGPGLFTNLTFNQDAVPFNQYVLQTHIGPISVTSLYGDLLGINGNQNEKNLYAHRYEWRPGTNWLLGITDQLILYEESKTYLFLPIFPLFIAKSYVSEDNNNGLIAADATYRLPGYGLLYSEFLLDDMESVSSLLLKNYRENKWGVMAGTQWGKDLWGKRCGLVAEFSHVEPWVYTHFPDYPAQASNGNYPLGNPFGPNSQAMVLKAFTRPTDNLYASAKLTLLWKGSDSGSFITDSYAEGDNLLSKSFINGVDAPQVTVSPYCSYTWRYLHGELEADLQQHPAFYLRIQVQY